MNAVPLIIQLLLFPLIVYMAYSHASLLPALGIYLSGILYRLALKRRGFRYFSLLVGAGIMFMLFMVYLSKAYVEAMRIPFYVKKDVMVWFWLYYAGVFVLMVLSVYQWLLGPYKDRYTLVLNTSRPGSSASVWEQIEFYLILLQEFKRTHESWLVKSFVKYVGVGALVILLILYADSKATLGYGIEYVFSKGDYLARVILQMLPLLAFMLLGMFRWDRFNIMVLLAPFLVWIGVSELQGINHIGSHMAIAGLFLLLFAAGFYTGEVIAVRLFGGQFSRTPAMATSAGSVPISDGQLTDMVVPAGEPQSESGGQSEALPTIEGSLEEVLSNMDSLLKAYRQAYPRKKVENPYANLRTGDETLDRILDRFRKSKIAMYEKKFLEDLIERFVDFEVL